MRGEEAGSVDAAVPDRMPPPSIDREVDRQRAAESRFDVIACVGCGRSFATIDGPAMLDAIKGPCPSCGGAFRLRAR